MSDETTPQTPDEPVEGAPTPQTGLDIERSLFTALFATRDRETGMASFVENGPGKAVFEGA